MNAALGRPREWVTMWPLLALLVCLPGALGVSRFHERNMSSVIAMYTFQEGQLSETPPTHVRDLGGRGLGDLMVSTRDVTWSASQQGMMVPSIAGNTRAISSWTSADMAALLPNAAISIELIARCKYFDDIPWGKGKFIAGMGDWRAWGYPGTACDAWAGPESTGVWAVWQRTPRSIYFTVIVTLNGVRRCISDAVIAPCFGNSYFGGTGEFSAMLAVGNGGFAIYLNAGVSDAFGTVLEPVLAQWTAAAAPLEIARPASVTTTWADGMIRALVFHNRSLTESEFNQLRALGPPNSFPYGAAGGVTATEDAPLVLVSM